MISVASCSRFHHTSAQSTEDLVPSHCKAIRSGASDSFTVSCHNSSDFQTTKSLCHLLSVGSLVASLFDHWKIVCPVCGFISLVCLALKKVFIASITSEYEGLLQTRQFLWSWEKSLQLSSGFLTMHCVSNVKTGWHLSCAWAWLELSVCIRQLRGSLFSDRCWARRFCQVAACSQALCSLCQTWQPFFSLVLRVCF